MPDPTSPRPLRWYGRLADAREQTLVLVAKDIPHVLERDGDGWSVSVPGAALEEAERELAGVEEELGRAAPVAQAAPPRVSSVSLWAAGWLLAVGFGVQEFGPEEWLARGTADARRIVQAGEWWRTVTALTLHGDGAHLLANLATGLLFAAGLLRVFGGGVAWLLIVVAGALGNALNAWGYREAEHLSIGASTAVFGALGLLVGAEAWVQAVRRTDRHARRLLAPLGAGLALLAFLGTGNPEGGGRATDVLAHGWGFVAGLGLGAAAGSLLGGRHLGARWQRGSAALALGSLGVSWALAWNSGR